MKKHNKDVLKATLFALIAIFIMIGAAGLLFAEHKKKIQKEQQKKAAIEALERVPTVTPTPVITRAPAFMANDYMGTWYSKDGLVTLSIDDLTLKSVTFTFSQAGDNAGTKVSEASDTAKVAGNAAKLSFTEYTLKHATLNTNPITITNINFIKYVRCFPWALYKFTYILFIMM